MVELVQQMIRFVVQRLEVGMFHPIFAAHLLDDQLAVAANENLSCAEPFRFHKRRDEGPVFGGVVGCPTDESSEGDKRSSVLRAKNHADSCWTRISTRASVEFQGD